MEQVVNVCDGPVSTPPIQCPNEAQYRITDGNDLDTKQCGDHLHASLQSLEFVQGEKVTVEFLWDSDGLHSFQL